MWCFFSLSRCLDAYTYQFYKDRLLLRYCTYVIFLPLSLNAGDYKGRVRKLRLVARWAVVETIGFRPHTIFKLRCLRFTRFLNFDFYSSIDSEIIKLSLFASTCNWLHIANDIFIRSDVSIKAVGFPINIIL